MAEPLERRPLDFMLTAIQWLTMYIAFAQETTQTAPRLLTTVSAAAAATDDLS